MVYGFDRYLKIRGASGASWSPDGRRVSFLTDITGVSQVWEVPAGGGWPEQLTFYDERVAGALYSPVEDRVLFGIDAGGNERMQIFILGRGEERDLTGDTDAIHYSGGFAPNGRQIAYTATRRNGTDFDVYAQSLEDGAEAELVWEVVRLPHNRRLESGWQSPDRQPPPLQPRQRSLPPGPGEPRSATANPARVRRPLYRGKRDPGRGEHLPRHGPGRRLSAAGAPGHPHARARVPDARRPGRRERGTFQGRTLPGGCPQRRGIFGFHALQRPRKADAHAGDAGRYTRRLRVRPGFEAARVHAGRAGSQPRCLDPRPAGRGAPAPYPLLDGWHPPKYLPPTRDRPAIPASMAARYQPSSTSRRRKRAP